MVNIKLADDVETPRYESNGAAGFDLAASRTVTIRPFEVTLIPTGVVVETPRDHMLVLALRSSAPSRHGIIMPHGVGIVDEDYCGNDDTLKIQVMCLPGAGRPEHTHVRSWEIQAGTRIAQGIFVPIRRGEFQTVADMGMQSRGGFGSTGT